VQKCIGEYDNHNQGPPPNECRVGMSGPRRSEKQDGQVKESSLGEDAVSTCVLIIFPVTGHIIRSCSGNYHCSLRILNLIYRIAYNNSPKSCCRHVCESIRVRSEFQYLAPTFSLRLTYFVPTWMITVHLTILKRFCPFLRTPFYHVHKSTYTHHDGD
jgi:hypothetical protein